MKAKGISSGFNDAKADALAVVVFKGEKADSGLLKEIDAFSGGVVSQFISDGSFTGTAGETQLIYSKNGKLFLLGVGDKAAYTLPDVAKASGAAVRALRKQSCKSLAFAPRFENDAAGAAAAAVQGAITSQFELGKYKTTGKKDNSIDSIIVYLDGAKPADLKKGCERGSIMGDSINFSRDLSNEPPNILTPMEMANRAKVMAKEAGLKCQILNEADMKKLGMGSILSVSNGSPQPAAMIVLTYMPAKSTAKKGEKIALVGKGVTFDTGGISLKPSSSMEAMKYDMTGAATVMGTMRAIGMLKPSVPVIGVCGCVENMPDGNATRPSDVVTAMNGKTIEILNTDAEGRLVLADAVAYAEKLGATTIVDMATLTGAVLVALGTLNTGILGNDQEVIDNIISAGKEVDESYWQLPIGEGYSKLIKSDIADMKNIAAKANAGTIIGAVFIQEFIDKAKWAHLDIAGTAWDDSGTASQGKGPTGVAIQTLTKFVENSQ